MNKKISALEVFSAVIGVVNIILGLFFMLIILMIQGFYLAFLGIPFIVFGYSLLHNKIRRKLLFIAIVPISIILSIIMMMMGISNNVPKYYYTPIWVGLIIISPFWLAIIGNILLCVKEKNNKGNNNKDPVVNSS